MFLWLFLYCVLLLFINLMLRCFGGCAFSASFVRECTDVSYVAVHKGVFAQLIYDRNYSRNLVMHLADFR